MRLGQHVGPKVQHRIKTLHSHLEMGAWAREASDAVPQNFPTRFDLFQQAVDRVAGRAPLYLEFGVYQGESLRWWAENLSAPGAMLVGFDSFEGLPEDWNTDRKKGAFAVGRTPDIEDDRVSYQVGWFDATVPIFEMPEHDQLIVNIDSDIYSSAVIVLDRMEPYLVPGTLIYFDELNDRDHELRALREFLARSGKNVRALGMAKGGVHWLFEVV